MKYPRGKHGEIIRECVEAHGAEVEYIGTGHIKITFPNKEEVFCAATPSDNARSWLNLRSAIERIAGIKFERQNSGKYTHCRVTPFTATPPTTRSATTKALDAKERELNQLSKRIGQWLENRPSADQMKRVEHAVEQWHDLANELRSKGRDVPKTFMEQVKW